MNEGAASTERADRPMTATTAGLKNYRAAARCRCISDSNRRLLRCERTVPSVLTRPFPRTFLVARRCDSLWLRHDPSPPRTLKKRKDPLRQSSPDRFTDRDSRPYCWLSQRWASGSGSLLTTITFLGKRQAIADPEARCQFAGQTTETVKLTSAQRRSATRTGSCHLSGGHGGGRARRALHCLWGARRIPSRR